MMNGNTIPRATAHFFESAHTRTNATQRRPLSVPIALNYHAGGLKVGETSSWVGLGWSLQAGGKLRGVKPKPIRFNTTDSTD